MLFPSPLRRTARRLNKLLWKKLLNCRKDFLRADRFGLGTLDNGTFLLCGWLLHDFPNTDSKMCEGMIWSWVRCRPRDKLSIQEVSSSLSKEILSQAVACSIKDDFQSELRSLRTLMFIGRTRWNANLCYSLRTTYLIFETFQSPFPTDSLIFTAVKLFHEVI